MSSKQRYEKISLKTSITLKTLYHECGIGWPELCRRFPRHSPRSICRHATAPYQHADDKRKNNAGRPKLLSERDERLIIRTLLRLRKHRASFSAKSIQEECQLFHVSLQSIYRVLRKNGYRYRQSRKKGLLSGKDKVRRLKFAKQTRVYAENFWTDNITFYFDGVGFAHRTNPYAEARAVSSMAWRKPGEGLNITTKGRKEGSAGKMANFFVAIAHGSGVVCCKQYAWRVTGERFALFIMENFRGKMLVIYILISTTTPLAHLACAY